MLSGLAFAFVNRKHLLAMFRRALFHQRVTAQFNGIVLSQLQQVGLYGIGIAVVDAHFGDDVHIDFAK